jgi:hypothetical protein
MSRALGSATSKNHGDTWASFLLNLRFVGWLNHIFSQNLRAKHNPNDT